ncbi:MptD family putative ECF transporter S component [Leucobacter musarum]|uniref:MptD family putative ECF transporter S component n=1 Tax=Leucobacter musarum TaxID=1930747 RepID=UPI0009EA415B|nr:MptD family putative ECF transporter S component [Leucobacter musarum]
MTEPISSTAAASAAQPAAETQPAAAAPDRPAAARRTGARFSARDLLNVAIFVVIYFIVIVAITMIGAISPLVMLIIVPLCALAGGIPYMLFLTRVKHAGMVTLFGTVNALIYFMMGHPWQSLLFTILCSVAAEFVLAAGKYRSKWAAIGTYTVFSAWFLGPWIPLILDRAAYLQSAGLTEMGPEFVAAFDQIVSLPALFIMWGATVVLGFFGGLLGSAVLRKHFRKAGLA